MRKIITERRIESVLISDISGNIEEIISLLKSKVDKLSNAGYTNIVFYPDSHYDGYYEIMIDGDRPESDEERSCRLRKAKITRRNNAEQKKKIEEKERRDLIRLKAKYEKD